MRIRERRARSVVIGDEVLEALRVLARRARRTVRRGVSFARMAVFRSVLREGVSFGYKYLWGRREGGVNWASRGKEGARGGMG